MAEIIAFPTSHETLARRLSAFTPIEVLDAITELLEERADALADGGDEHGALALVDVLDALGHRWPE